MKASDAIIKVDGCTALELELLKLATSINTNSDMRSRLSNDCKVDNISARLEYAAEMIHEYHVALNAALARTEIKGLE